MYESLKKHTKSFHLYIFAFDDLSHEILNKMNLEFVTVISLSEFENPDLLKIKETRTKAEYCWTCTPSTIDYVLNNYNVPNCTYLDADLVFYANPKVLFDELANKSVLITEHRYAKTSDLYEQNRGGRFCVQFVTFKEDEKSKAVLTKWKDQCIDWCYARYEDGKFGDQKYLDEWPGKYSNVHILEHLGGGLAPWNVSQYKFKNENGLYGIDKKNKNKFEIIFYHFHFVRFYKNGTVDIGWHYLPEKIIKYLYIPYINKIKETEKSIQQINSNYKPFIFDNKPNNFKDFLKKTFKQISRYNLLKVKL
jgi:hypothetical protein